MEIDGSNLCDATIRVRESNTCASVILAETLSDFVPQIEIQHSDSDGTGWRQALVKVPAIITQGDLGLLGKHTDVVGKPGINVVGNDSWLVVGLRDAALNEVMNLHAIFQVLTEHTATPKYEDFSILIHPPEAVDKIVKSLANYGHTSLLNKKAVPFEAIPKFRFDLTVDRALSEGERRILRAAVEKGWFDYPRSPDGQLKGLAAELGESEGALSVKLRQINRKLSMDYLRKFIVNF